MKPRLCDTGSPISIDFLSQILNRNWTEGTSKEEWASSVRDRLKPPRMTVRNFGGVEVNVIFQCTMGLACGERSCSTTVLVQKEVSQGELLGTDVLKRLEFRVLIPDTEGRYNRFIGN